MTTKILRSAVAASVALALILVPGPSVGAPTKIKATARNTWNPDFQHISPGTRIVWVNPARHDTVHDITAYGRNWSKRVVLQPGERTGKRFRKVGTYKYFCRAHGHRSDGQCHGMCGVVHVAR